MTTTSIAVLLLGVVLALAGILGTAAVLFGGPRRQDGEEAPR